MYCAKLGNNICGDSGLTLQYGVNRQYSKTICYERQMYTGQLARGSNAFVSIIYMSYVDFETDCFFWCTEDGQIPEITKALPWSDVVENTIVSYLYRTFPLQSFTS